LQINKTLEKGQPKVQDLVQAYLQFLGLQEKLLKVLII
jgi:hypothetical protein